MPHCIVEYSSDIQPQTLLENVYQGTLDSELFDKSGKDIKVRALSYENFSIGDAKEIV
jgi:5-carboxymethyl-2-hydroxymuconate isomerase